ncbi:MAG: thioredoxin family protein [Bacteroidales bacterium]|jgi:peroxiredoxin|nr:thioredoxin family protein [Bacteroidales bacterium]
MKTLLFIASSFFLLSACNSNCSQNNENDAKFTDTKVSEKKEEKSDETKSKGYNIGDEATDFSLQNVDGNMVSLSDYEDAQGFIVIFTCNHCPYAVAYEDRIIDLHVRFAPLGYPVIAINPNDSKDYPEDNFEAMQKRAQEKQFPFVYLFDKGQKIYPQYGATHTPHVFVLEKENNRNIVQYIGAIDNNYENPDEVTETYVADAVNALLKNTEVPKTKTVAIGCSIKN